MGITFIATGLMSMSFSGFTGIKLANPTGGEQNNELKNTVIEQEAEPAAHQ